MLKNSHIDCIQDTLSYAIIIWHIKWEEGRTGEQTKNAILKQYQKLLELDEVKLEFDEGALEAIAEKALEKDTGARALRAIIEDFMLDIMYEIPKDDNIGRVTITRAYIEGTGGPIIDIRSNGCGLEERDSLEEIEQAK